jgi:hypothetical protein
MSVSDRGVCGSPRRDEYHAGSYGLIRIAYMYVVFRSGDPLAGCAEGSNADGEGDSLHPQLPCELRLSRMFYNARILPTPCELNKNRS